MTVVQYLQTNIILRSRGGVEQLYFLTARSSGT